MKVKGIGDRKQDTYKYIKLKMYLQSSNSNTALINREFYIISNLTAKVLIGIDIMKPKGIVIDLGTNIMKIGACKDLPIPINITSKGARVNTTLLVYTYIVDYNISEVFIRNDTDYEITLLRRTKLGNITKYDTAGAFAVNPN